MTAPEFLEFPKTARLSRLMTVTEKLDGTNAQVMITDDGDMFIGSRTRWITPGDDNYGFARWAVGNKEELLKLGPGRHFGEWWGSGIQRNYGLKEKRFSLFNVGRWYDPRDCGQEVVERRAPAPACCYVVPILLQGPFSTDAVEASVNLLEAHGSYAAPGFMNPEGVMVFHEAARIVLKKTIKDDESPKSLSGG